MKWGLFCQTLVIESEVTLSNARVRTRKYWAEKVIRATNQVQDETIMWPMPSKLNK